MAATTWPRPSRGSAPACTRSRWPGSVSRTVPSGPWRRPDKCHEHLEHEGVCRMRLRWTVVSLLLSATLAACDSGGGTGGDVVGVDYPRSDTDFWNSYIRYVPRYGDQFKLDLKTTNSQNDVAALTSNVQTFISQGVKGVVMAPQDTAAIARALKQLSAKKIPVVSVDTRPESGDVYMVVRADNRAYGEKACQFLVAKLNGQCKVVMMQGDFASINGRDRTEAFNDCMKKDFPKITVFGEATNWDAATASQ